MSEVADLKTGERVPDVAESNGIAAPPRPAASAIGSLVLSYTAAPNAQIDASSMIFARKFAYDIMHIYAFKMAAVFMITTSTLAVYTRFTPRWIAMLGYASAAVILIFSGYLDWLLFVFPCWVLVVSIYILSENLRKERQAVAEHV